MPSCYTIRRTHLAKASPLQLCQVELDKQCNFGIWWYPLKANDYLWTIILANNYFCKNCEFHAWFLATSFLSATHFERAKRLKNCEKNNSQGIVFITISCQRVCNIQLETFVRLCIFKGFAQTDQRDSSHMTVNSGKVWTPQKQCGRIVASN